MKRVAKKRVKSWVHKTFLCSLRPWWPWHHRFWPNDTKLWSSLPRIRAEFFAGSAHLTEEPAAKGYNVLEPRGVLLGHNLFEPLQQETVFNDINYKKPKLFWVVLGRFARHQVVPMATFEVCSTTSSPTPSSCRTTPTHPLCSGMCLGPDRQWQRGDV